jgi:hypothetical protein
MAKARAVGERGSWFAKVNGERLPCVHKYWVKGLHHCDPGYIEGEKQWMELVEAIRQKSKVILTKDDKTTEVEKKSGAAFSRTGYIAVYSVANVEADELGLRFELTDRICDLQG